MNIMLCEFIHTVSMCVHNKSNKGIFRAFVFVFVVYYVYLRKKILTVYRICVYNYAIARLWTPMFSEFASAALYTFIYIMQIPFFFLNFFIKGKRKLIATRTLNKNKKRPYSKFPLLRWMLMKLSKLKVNYSKFCFSFSLFIVIIIIVVYDLVVLYSLK